MLRRTILIAAGAALLLVGAVSASGRSTADSFAGTWNILARAGTPWASGGTLTIRASTRAEVAAFAIAPPAGRFSQMHGVCLGFDPPSPAEPNYVPPAVTGWYVATASWDSAPMAGCLSDKTAGRVKLFSQGETATSSVIFQDPIIVGFWRDVGFESKRPEQGTTKTISEPKPGGSEDVSSPEFPPGGADCAGSPGRVSSSTRRQTCEVTVSSSAGTLDKTTIVAEGEATPAQKGGEAVAACWLIGPDALQIDNEHLKRDLTDPLFKKDFDTWSAQRQLGFCMGIVRLIGEKRPTRSEAAATRCRVQRLGFAFRKRKGKVVSIRLAKSTAKSVNYSCSPSGGSATVKLTGPSKGNLRQALGRKLDLGVYRTKKAPRRSGKLTFTFGW